MSNANKFLIVFMCGIVSGWALGLVEGWYGFVAVIILAWFGAILSRFAAASVEDTL